MKQQSAGRRAFAIACLALAALLPAVLAGAGPFRFEAARLFPAGEDPRSQVLADFDGDGVLDLASVNETTLEIAILGGNGDGTFDPPVLHPLPYEPSRVVTGDLNGDGSPDLAISSWWHDVVMVLLNDGSAGFTLAGAIPVGDRPLRMVLADLDGDNDLDLVATNNDGLAVMLNNGDGSFAPADTWYAGENPGYPAVGDVTGDGLPDLLAGNFLSEYYFGSRFWGEVWILSGLGDGTFGPASWFTTEDAISAMLLGDLDGDDVLDLVTLESRYTEYFDLISGDLVLYRGQGGGAFGSAEPVEQARYEYLAWADLNGDGVLDLVTGEDRGGLKVLRGLPGGGFAPPLIGSSGAVPEYPVFGDLDGDGTFDLVARMNSDVGVLIGTGDCRFHDVESSVMETGVGSLDLVDLDDDGDLDLLAACSSGYLALVKENMDTGVFAPPVFHGVDSYTSSAQQAVAADFDSDGILDFAVVREEDPCLAVFRGTGGLSYDEPQWFSFDPEGRSIAVTDLDGDGENDLVLATEDALLVLRNDGAAGFELVGSYVTGLDDRNLHLTAADLDGDGIDELAVTSTDNWPAVSHLTLFPGLGGGSFGNQVSHPVAHIASMSSAGDLDGDGHTDLAVASRGEGTTWEGSVQVFYGYGDGTLADPVTIPTGSSTYWAGIISIDGDGLLDLVSASKFSGDVRIHFGDTSGTFETWESYTAGYWPELAALGDIDQDGDIDVITDGSTGDGIAVLRNRTMGSGTVLGWMAVGPGPCPQNPPAVRLFTAPDAGAPVKQWTAYGAGGYGTNVAFGDIDGNGAPEILTGPGPGQTYGPHVRAFRLDGLPITGFDFMAYGTHRYGVNVAAGELDWRTEGVEIVTGAGPGPVFGPHVRCWTWEDDGPVRPLHNGSFFAYGTPKWGVNVACGDLYPDQLGDEIVTGPGPGSVYGPHVRAFEGDGTPIPEVSFFAYGTLQFGVKVACGDIDGDGLAEIVTAPGPGRWFTPHVRGWNWDGDGVVEPMAGVNFFAYADGRFGATVSCADIDGDGIDEILTGRGSGPDLDGRVRGWNYDGEVLGMMPGIDFLAWEPGTTTHGATVAGEGR